MNLGPRAPKVVAKASPARALQRLWNWLMALSSRLVWAVMCLSVLNLVLFLLFSGLYISRGIQLDLLDPLHQAEDRLARKIEDGELQLDCLPREGLGERAAVSADPGTAGPRPGGGDGERPDGLL